MSNLRKTLGDGRLQGRPPGYVLLLEPFELDADRFDSLVRDATKAMSIDPDVAARRSTTHSRSGADPRSPTSPTDELVAASPRPPGWTNCELEAQEDRVEGLLASGDHARVRPVRLEALVAQHPLRERLWELLMLALYRSGTAGGRAGSLPAGARDPGGRTRDRSFPGARSAPRAASCGRTRVSSCKGEPLRGYRLLEKLGDGPDGCRLPRDPTHRWSATSRSRSFTAGRSRVTSAFVRRFEPTPRRSPRLEHPHIVPIYDYWREPGGAYVVSRYLRGGQLRRAAGRGNALEPDRAATLFEQIADAARVRPPRKASRTVR